jgi:hypothetical protein
MPTSSPFADNRRPTDVIVQQGGGDFADARVNAHRNDVGNHHICSLTACSCHIDPLLRIRGN